MSDSCPDSQDLLAVKVISFGYKEGQPPVANMVFDVRFLKNPYWVPELRPLNGLDKPVSDYVLGQPLAESFLSGLHDLVKCTWKQLQELEIKEFTVAFGCTGGQHRSVALAEAFAKRLQRELPDGQFTCLHREMSAAKAVLPASGVSSLSEHGDRL